MQRVFKPEATYSPQKYLNNKSTPVRLCREKKKTAKNVCILITPLFISSHFSFAISNRCITKALQ